METTETKQRKLQILLVEDEEDHAILVKRSFSAKSHDIEILIAGTLAHAREIISEVQPDLVISDYLLPDGRAMDILPMDTEDISFPFIVITSHGDEHIAVEAMKAGALDYVVKSDNSMLDMPHIAERALREWNHITERKFAEKKSRESLIKLHKTMDGIINAMVLTIEARDPYTAGHQKKVAYIAEAIAVEMGLTQDQLDAIRMAGLIHDLGKIYVPSEILSKPGRISEAEFDIIKTHPSVGYDILKTIEFPWPIADIVLQHHERINGSGYPGGITGDRILIEAKIISVADVVEAMATHRPYRAALGINIALEEIKRNRNKLYDSDVADACIKLFEERHFTFEL